ncbi:MAG: hypothetical protein IJ312_03140 [Treponema sp.]|nr:hypothetical protein [Treponema sp.]
MQNTFYDFLLTYDDFLEKTSYKVIEKAEMSLVNDDIRQINENLRQLKIKNNKNLSSIVNAIRNDDETVKLFDITTKYSTRTQKIAVVHFFVELLLNKHISLNRIFRRRNGKSKIWTKINDLLTDDLLFLFSEAYLSNTEPIIKVEIL